MFIPPDDYLASLVSDISGDMVEHLKQIDEFMKHPEQLKDMLKQHYLIHLKNQLNME